MRFYNNSLLQKTSYHSSNITSITRPSYDLSKVEIIIVDDVSIEYRPNLSEFCGILSIKYLFQADEGYRVSAARNLGILHSRFDHIIILDCDLAVAPGFLKAHLDIISKSKNVVSIGLRDSYFVNDQVVPGDFKDKSLESLNLKLKRKDWRLKRIENSKDYESSNACWRLCSGGNLGFHKSLFNKVGEFNERFQFWGGEDNEWAYRAYKRSVLSHTKNVLSSHIECHVDEFQTPRSVYLEKRNLLFVRSCPRI